MNVPVCSCGPSFLTFQAIRLPGEAAALIGQSDDEAAGAFMTMAANSCRVSHAELFAGTFLP